ncbi:MAG: hypothetical protein JW761_14120, partial [Prolixibacteraceae bacterium]|nr:hypothetical protein [Prolixibacteraceae bacterium]
GFAQVGDPDYYKKNLVEMNYLLDLINEKFSVPEQFTFTCFFVKKSFPHEFVTYHEIVLYFDEVVLDEWKDSDDEFIQGLFDEFWDWFNHVEAFDLESEEITERIQELYCQSLNTQKAEHLNVVRA